MNDDETHAEYKPSDHDFDEACETLLMVKKFKDTIKEVVKTTLLLEAGRVAASVDTYLDTNDIEKFSDAIESAWDDELMRQAVGEMFADTIRDADLVIKAYEVEPEYRTISI